MWRFGAAELMQTQHVHGSRPPSKARVLIAGLIGNVMEWYDFALYGYFATVIGQQFFPSTNQTASLIGAFGAFAAGFLVRPLGGIVYGRIGDLVGRRRALSLSVIAMAIPTVAMAFLPTHAQIGIAAPIAVVLLRLLQGISAGGEYTTSIIFLAEAAPDRQRGFYSIWGLWGSVLGMLMGSAFGDLLTRTLTQPQLDAWGWRVAFALGSLVALTGVIIRQGVGEDDAAATTKTPLASTLGVHRPAFLRVLALNIASSVGFYAVYVYLVTYVEVVDGISDSMALSLNTDVMAVLLLLYPITAWLSDRIGRRPLLMGGAALLCVGAIPFLQLIHSQDPQLIVRGELGFTLAIALVDGGKGPANVELMPAEVRCTGTALAYNLAEGWFGGTTPLIAAVLVAWASGNPIYLGIWVGLSGLCTFVTAAFFTRETAFKPLLKQAQAQPS